MREKKFTLEENKLQKLGAEIGSGGGRRGRGRRGEGFRLAATALDLFVLAHKAHEHAAVAKIADQKWQVRLDLEQRGGGT